MENKTLRVIFIAMFIGMITLLGCRHFKNNTSESKPRYFKDGELPPETALDSGERLLKPNILSGELGSEEYIPMQLPDYMELTPDEKGEVNPEMYGEYQNPPFYIIKDPGHSEILPPDGFKDLIPDSSVIIDVPFLDYYKTPKFTQEDRDSLLSWINRFQPIDTQREIKNLVAIAGERFFKYTDAQLKYFIHSNIHLDVPDSLVNYNFWAGQIDYHYNYLFNSGSDIEGPIEHIWKEENVFFSRNSNYTYDFGGDKKLQKIFNQIKSVSSEYNVNTSSSTLQTPSLLKSVKEEIESLQDDRRKVKMYFLLWHRLYTQNLADSNWIIVDSINNISNWSKQLTSLEKADWDMALAKIYASVNFNRNPKSPFNYLNGVLGLLEGKEDKIYFEKRNKTILTMCMYFFFLNDRLGREFALNLCITEFRKNYSKLTPEEISSFYAYTAFFWILYIKDKEDLGEAIKEKEYLNFFYNLINIKKDDEQVSNKNLRIILTSLCLYYEVSKCWDCHKKSAYAFLSQTLLNPSEDNQMFSTQDAIYFILYNNKEFDDSLEYNSWRRFDFYNYSKERGKKEFYTWSQEEQSKFESRAFKNPVDTLIGKYNKYWLKKTLIAMADGLAYTGKLQNSFYLLYDAYTLRKKADSINVNSNPAFYYELGFNSRMGYGAIREIWLFNKVDSIKNEILALEKNKKILLQEITNASESLLIVKNDLNDSINQLQDSVKKWTKEYGSMETLKNQAEFFAIQEREAKEEASFYRDLYKVLVFVLCLLIVYVYYLRRKAMLISKFNKYKSNIWQELGHTPGTSIDKLYEKLLKIKGITETDLKPLLALKGLIGGLFASIVKGNSKIGNPFANELILAQEYIDYNNSVKGANIQLDCPTNINLNIPPALLVSCIRNAIEHGKLLDKPIGKIEIVIKEKAFYTEVKILNNGKPFEPRYLKLKNLKETSTGLKNIRNVLLYFNRNRWIKKSLRWKNINHPEYKSETILKIAHYAV